MRVYLAGGMKSDWQNAVMFYAPGPEYLDPRSHGIEDPTLYTDWDLDAISRCDIVFAYLEQDNPGGMNMAMEMGFAAANGKQIIYVDEKAKLSPLHERHTTMLREISTFNAVSLSEGIAYLKALTGVVCS